MGFGPFFFITNKMLNRRSDKLELLRIAEAVALEKSIDKELIIDSMESGIAKAAKSKFGSENEIKVLINRDNGDIGIFRKLIIVDASSQISKHERLPAILFATILEKYCKINSIGYIPLYQSLEKAKANGIQTSWIIDGHFNENGYRIFGEAMFQWIEARNE